MIRPPRILHCTSEPLVFFGRHEELELLERALNGQGPSVVALVGPGGQGKTAIVQHWLRQPCPALDGLFFWSFYRGKDVDHCLREWLAYAEGMATLPEVSASWCVDRLVPLLRRERWAVVLDGAEVVQYEDGPWRGRFLHPDLGRLLEDLASEPLPGVVVLTTRFELPTLLQRPFVRLVSLDRLDPASARDLLRDLGVQGAQIQLDAIADAAGRHAKAVELLGTLLVHFHQGRAESLAALPGLSGSGTDEEASVLGVLTAYQRTLSVEHQDVLALATAFREPPREQLLLDYLSSQAVKTLLHTSWHRHYTPFVDRPTGWLAEQIEFLVRLRLLERVGPGSTPVIDAHPLVRRGFEHTSEGSGQQSALARAGFLCGRPDRRRPGTLEESREAIELFHAHCDAGLFTEADSAFVALENPKHRFLAPVLERDLLLRFFPCGDWRQPPLWPGFGRWRSLAICLELLGQNEAALEVYRPEDAALRGDALLALGRLRPLLDVAQVPAPWQTLWGAYRSHALCLAGRVEAGVALARSLVPVDIYEWVHVFECLLRAGRLDLLDLGSMLFRQGGEHRWAGLARRRMRADYLRVRQPNTTEDLDQAYHQLTDAYDRAGMPVERALTRLSHAAWLIQRQHLDQARRVNGEARQISEQSQLAVAHIDALEQALILATPAERDDWIVQLRRWREQLGITGPARP